MDGNAFKDFKASLLLPILLIFALIVRLLAFDRLGLGNPYYAATVKSMLVSWKNFFFAAAEPGGSVIVDKPPLGFWIQTVFAHTLGFSSLALILPQIIAGILSVLVLYTLVKNSWGEFPALVAGFVLAFSPVNIAADRNNTVDSILVLGLLIGCWAFVKAMRSDNFRYLVLGGLCFGVCFHIKTMQALIPLPAFYAGYWLTSESSKKKKVAAAALSLFVAAVVSLLWPVAVDLTPEDSRPYVMGSRSNSVLDLVIFYNGIDRLRGTSPGGGAPPEELPPGGRASFPPGGLHSKNFHPDPPGPMGPPPPFIEVGLPGFSRFFLPPLAKEMSWLLPFVLLGVITQFILKRRVLLRHKGFHPFFVFVLWLATGLLLFSFASFFHSYYLVVLVPPLAAVAGILAGEFWKDFQEYFRWSLIFLLVISITLLYQSGLVLQYRSSLWIPLLALMFFFGGMLLFAVRHSCTLTGQKALTKTSFALLMVSILWTPFCWSFLTALYPNPDPHLPSAYAGSHHIWQPIPDWAPSKELLSFLEERTTNAEYLLAVPDANIGAPYVLATGRPVLYLGGFSGRDPVIDLKRMKRLIEQGKLRYVLDAGSLQIKKPEIHEWLKVSCKTIDKFSTHNLPSKVRSMTSPGDTQTEKPLGPPLTLYDCSRKLGRHLLPD